MRACSALDAIARGVGRGRQLTVIGPGRGADGSAAGFAGRAPLAGLHAFSALPNSRDRRGEDHPGLPH